MRFLLTQVQGHAGSEDGALGAQPFLHIPMTPVIPADARLFFLISDISRIQLTSKASSA